MRLWRKRMLRLHFKDADHSIEGIFVGFAAGHYHLQKGVLWEARDRSLEIGETWVPRERVLHAQVLR